jgi:hypothetical protein
MSINRFPRFVQAFVASIALLTVGGVSAQLSPQEAAAEYAIDLSGEPHPGSGPGRVTGSSLANSLRALGRTV